MKRISIVLYISVIKYVVIKKRLFVLINLSVCVA